jgi:hypothetical protein
MFIVSTVISMTLSLPNQLHSGSGYKFPIISLECKTLNIIFPDN